MDANNSPHSPARRRFVSALAGAAAVVEKHMSTPPAARRIARLPVTVTLPASVPHDMRERLERVGHTCPVKASLHPEVEAPITYTYR